MSPGPASVGDRLAPAPLFSAALFLMIYALVHGNDKGLGQYKSSARWLLSVVLLIILAGSKPTGNIRFLRPEPLFRLASSVPASLSACHHRCSPSSSSSPSAIQAALTASLPWRPVSRFLPITGMMLGPPDRRPPDRQVQVRYLLSGGLPASLGIFPFTESM